MLVGGNFTLRKIGGKTGRNSMIYWTFLRYTKCGSASCFFVCFNQMISTLLNIFYYLIVNYFCSGTIHTLFWNRSRV
jgi:hypothetical protein